MQKKEFLEKARHVHGYKYLYPSLDDKIIFKDVIDIIYKNILYKQSISKHLMGRCPEKNTPPKTTKQFIEESFLVWGNKYDYSLTDYRGSLKIVKIIYDGVVFEQIASSHLKGLAVELKYNKDYFIKKSLDRWGNKYDYSLVDFKNVKSKIRIIHKSTGVIYEQTPSNHLKYAAENISLSTKSNTQTFIERSNKIHDFKYDYSLTDYTVSSNKVVIICKIHGQFDQVANSHILGMGCKKCGDLCGSEKHEYIKKYETDEFISESRGIWSDKYDYSLTKYINARTKVKIIYDDIIYEQLPMSHLKYPVERYLDQKIFLIKAKRKWGHKYDYSLVKFISTKSTIKIIHKGEIYEQLPHNHLIYSPELRNTLTKEDFILRSSEIHNLKYGYELVNYVNDRIKVIINCPYHGNFFQTPSVHLRGSGCRRCNDSFGEKIIANFLNTNNIDYKREYIFNDCRNIYPLRFDFYLTSLRTCIEFDGLQHFQPVEYFGGSVAYETLKINDKIKNEWCEDNYIDLIRIRYDQIGQIGHILAESLKNKL